MLTFKRGGSKLKYTPSVSIVFIVTLLCDASIVVLLGSELMSVVYEGNAHDTCLSHVIICFPR